MKRISLILFLLGISRSLITVHDVNCLESESLIGGKRAGRHQFPFMVSISDANHHICGGTIVNSDSVLTAAHCVCSNDNGSEIRVDRPLWVVVGANDLKNENLKGIRMPVKKVYVSDDYDPETSIGDVAVLKLLTPLSLKDYKHVWEIVNLDFGAWKTEEKAHALIPSFGYREIIYRIGKNGRIRSFNYRQDGILMYGDTLIMSNKQCQKKYSERSKIIFRKITKKIYDSLMCSKIIPKNKVLMAGICPGDSGSPIIVNGNLQVGILSSAGTFCDDSIVPSVSVRISAYENFITAATLDKIWNSNIKYAKLPINESMT